MNALYPYFSGTIQYEIEFDLGYESSYNYYLDLGDVYEVAEVFINDEHVGTKIVNLIILMLPIISNMEEIFLRLK